MKPHLIVIDLGDVHEPVETPIEQPGVGYTVIELEQVIYNQHARVTIEEDDHGRGIMLTAREGRFVVRSHSSNCISIAVEQ